MADDVDKPESTATGAGTHGTGAPDAEAAGSGATDAGTPDTAGLDFVRAIVTRDVAAGKHGGRVATRFPPEPNGYLHIGHAKSICLNFDVAAEFDGTCNLRFDDTNPTTEDPEYVEAIQRDVRWLGYEWDGDVLYASDYFGRFYGWAEDLVREGLAYVDSQSEEEIRKNRGTVTEPGVESPYRDRSPEENLELLRGMRAGEYADGEHVLRAKIDMAHPNMKMRDPLLYRIRHATHYRTGDEWCVYPMYDFAHPLSDAIEEITHSLCTLEFENNRDIYDWLIEHCNVPGEPHQYEFARLNLDYTVMSKRKLLRLVREGHVDGWDDPRMPTIAGLRRRGVKPESIRGFCDLIGVAKADSRVDIGKLEYAIREDLNVEAPRVMCVIDPLKVVVTSWPEGEVDELEAPHFPHDVGKEGSRPVPFSRELWIERDDFREDPPPDFYRLAPGREVRLRYGYFITCDEVVRDDDGEVVELRCTHDPETRGGSAPDGRTVRGTLHWVSAAHAVPCEVRLYDRLFQVPDPERAADIESIADPGRGPDTDNDADAGAGDGADGETDVGSGRDFTDHLNPASKIVVELALVEPSVAGTAAGTWFQFERRGYFFTDPEDSEPDGLVFNRVVTLRDTWARIARQREEEEREAERETRREREAREEEAPSGPSEPSGPTRTELRARHRAATPELASRYERYVEELGVPEDDADVLTGDLTLARFYDDAVADHDNPALVANWVVNEVLGVIGDGTVDDLPFGGGRLGELVALVDDDTITAAVGKEILQEMVDSGADPRALVEERGLEKIDDADTLEPLVDEILAAHSDKVEAYRGGHTGLLGFFMGQVMQRTDGTADPRLARELFEEKLG